MRKGGWVSLRALLLPIGVGGALLWFWQSLGISLCLAAIFVLASIVPLCWNLARWRGSYLLAWTALYAPFVATASYTVAWVPCDHCKLSVWAALPYGPGLMPVGTAWELLNLPRPSDTLWFASAFCVSIATLVAMTWLLRGRSLWLKMAIAAVAASYSSFAAAVVLAMTRM
jgi:hypothetical protein